MFHNGDQIMKNKKWYRLDNSGKIFPPIMNSYDTCVFRISCTLKEEIDKKILQEALDKTLVDFPVFSSILRKGFFWYYIEEVESSKKVQEEHKAPCDNIYGVLYRVTYYKKRINLEVCHALTDANGATIFLRVLVANYLKIKYGVESEEEIDTASAYEKAEDAFKKYYKSFKKHKTGGFFKGYKIKGHEYDDYRLKFIEGRLSTSRLLSVVKENNCTVTQFLVSLLIKSIIMQMTEREKRKTIYITVPISLRKEFPTNTTRNFFVTMSIAYKSNDNDDIKDIIKAVIPQFEENLKKDNLYSKMSEMIFLENIFICRIVPRIIKNFVLKTSYNLTRRRHTMTLSNIGRVTMPKEYEDFIDSFSVISCTDGMQLNCLSYNDIFTFSFSSHFLKSEIQKNFVRELVGYGMDIVVDTNELEED